MKNVEEIANQLLTTLANTSPENHRMIIVEALVYAWGEGWNACINEMDGGSG